MLPSSYLLNNRYSIIHTVGKGGMGAVYEAVDTRLGNRVAVKQTLVAHTQNNTAFEHEARLLARLSHSALPMVTDFFTDNGAQFLVMQYIPGDDLNRLLQQRSQPFPVEHVLRWADTILDVLEYIHAQQPPVIHRDIKPHNIKLNGRGDAVLLDFGIAKGGNTTNQLANSIRAYTLHYAPLEQIQQQGTTEQSDLYSLGATLYQLLSRIVPNSSLDRFAAQSMRAPDPLREVHEFNPMLPSALSSILSQAMALEPRNRFQKANDMRRALRAAMNFTPAVGSPPAQISARVAVPSAPTTMSTGPTITLNPPSPSPSQQRSPNQIVSQPTPATPNQVVNQSTPAKKLSVSLVSPAAGLNKLMWWKNSPAPTTRLSPLHLWRNWVLANTLGMWLFLTLGVLIHPIVTVFFGVIMGFAQQRVLRYTQWFAGTKRWLIATSIAAPIALCVGILIDMATNLTPVLTGILGGAIGGGLLGLAQWWAIRKVAPISSLWMASQIIGWSIAVMLCAFSIGFVLIASLVSGVFGGALLYFLAWQEQRQSGALSAP